MTELTASRSGAVSNLRNYAWQQGYGAFSVGISQLQETAHYIEQQLEHHRTRTFQQE
jgi:putative transposase